MIHRESKEAIGKRRNEASVIHFHGTKVLKMLVIGNDLCQKREKKNEVINLRKVATLILSFESNLTFNILLLCATVKLI